MAIRKVLTYPNPKLAEKAREVTEFNEELQELARDMAETMYAEPGVGLAATQLGVDLRVITIDIRNDEGETGELLKLANPEITEWEGDLIWEEGCLSVPGVNENVKRSARVKVTAQDLAGNEVHFDAKGFLAVVFQHEIDHLDGVLFIDRLSPLKRAGIKKRLRREARREAESG